MKFIYSFILLIFMSSLSSFAQDKPANYCGYHEKSTWLTEYQKNKDNFRVTNGILYAPLTIHLVGNDGGSGHFSVSSTLDALCTLNKDFEPSEIQFYLAGEFRYHNNTDWFEHDFQAGRRMMRDNNVDGTINVYIVQDPAGNCGYFSPTGDAVALAKNCMGPKDHTFSHELGHFLSLPHPFIGWEGITHDNTQPAPETIDGWGTIAVEKVDGSNCEDAADGFCDTPPDYISDRWTCNSNGLSSFVQMDPNGETFQSDGTLIMSYSNDQCANRFSTEQMDAMRANLSTERSELLANQDPGVFIDVDQPIVLTEPAEGSSVDPTSFTLKWNAVPNATRYIVDIARLRSMNINQFHSDTLTTNQITVTGLTPNKQYYWRVKAYSDNSFCALTSDIGNFNTEVSSTNKVEGISFVETFPSPIKGNSTLNIKIGALEQSDMLINFYSLTGQLLMESKARIQEGENHIPLVINDFASGLYILELRNSKGQLQRKILVE